MSHDSVMWLSLSPPPLYPMALQISLEGFADLLIQSLITLEKNPLLFAMQACLVKMEAKG